LSRASNASATSHFGMFASDCIIQVDSSVVAPIVIECRCDFP
jgi:hypothetical protein